MWLHQSMTSRVLLDAECVLTLLEVENLLQQIWTAHHRLKEA